MSSNRLIYDKCEYDQRNQTNTNMLEHIIDEKRYRNKKNCTFKSAKIDQFIGARVDIESQLKNLDTLNSLFNLKYLGASGNGFTSIDELKDGRNLLYLNLSNNLIKKIDDIVAQQVKLQHDQSPKKPIKKAPLPYEKTDDGKVIFNFIK